MNENTIKESTSTALAIVENASKAVTTKNISEPVFAIPREKPRKKVLEEDVYVEAVSKIIERDFFPDLPKLRTQLEWLEAEEAGDLQKMREIQLRLMKKGSTSRNTPLSTPNSFTPQITPQATPATPSTPSTPLTPSQIQSRKRTAIESTDTAPITNLPLDKFQATHTSEDNASFDTIMEKHNLQKREKYRWLHDKEKETHQLMLEDGPHSSGLLTWGYTAKNSLMYNADGVALTTKEEKQANKGPPKEISYAHTRFHGPIFDDAKLSMQKSKDEEEQLLYSSLGAEERLLLAHQKRTDGKFDLDHLRRNIGPDGQVLPFASPQLGGYSFMMTPSPRPGVEASPFTTWGSIESTPLRLDPTDTPISLGGGAGPSFRLPETRDREKIALELADKAKKKSQKAKHTKQNPVTPLRIGTPSPLHTDHQLRASYSSGASPSVKRAFTEGSGTPITPSLFASPSPMRKLPKTGASPRIIYTKKATVPASPSQESTNKAH